MSIEGDAAEQLQKMKLDALEGTARILGECVKEIAIDAKPSVRQALLDIKRSRQTQVELPKLIVKTKGGVSR